jgi:Uma2 family endonuclease
MPRTTTTIIGPSDHGRLMSLDEFDLAECRDGSLYELGRGIITVFDVPGPRHLAQVNANRRQWHAYDAAKPGRIHTIASGGECKILIAGLDSERHPDLAIYKTPPPEEDIWSQWVPEIVVEVVSPSSRHRDYEEKPEEYLRFGVIEHWISDAERKELVVLRRSRGRWAERTIRPPASYRTRLLPGLDFACGPVFDDAAT